MSKLVVQRLAKNDIDEIAKAFSDLGWRKPKSQYESYLEEQDRDERLVLVAKYDNRFAGYSTIVWSSGYKDFQTIQIPEVKDLNVLPQFRKKGIGKALMLECEKEAKAKRHICLGLGVALLADYGSAQRLYFSLGYKPDGKGLHIGPEPVMHGQNLVVDDDLVLYLSKKI